MFYFIFIAGALGGHSQPTTLHLIDSCFNSTFVGASFPGSSNLINGNSDLLYWNGNGWYGQWSNANINLSPPTGSQACRAIWLGAPINWTSGGEYFGARFTPPLVAGNTYTLQLTYTSNGSQSTGNFAPTVYTSPTYNISSGTNIGSLPAASNTWGTYPFTFIATNSQAGHEWIFFKSNLSGSGLILSQCDSCQVPTLISNCAFSLGADTLVCPGQSVLLGQNQPGASYLWSDSSTSPFLSTEDTGVFWLNISTARCFYRDSIVIHHRPLSKPDLGADVQACTCDTSIALQGNIQGHYKWSTGDISDKITLRIKNQQLNNSFSTTVTDYYGCKASDTIKVEVRCLNANAGVLHPTGGVILSNQEADLHCNAFGYNGNFTYQWQPQDLLQNNNDEQVHTAPLNKPTQFFVTVTDDIGCSVTAPVKIDVLPVSHYTMPNAFTPNGDGLNDYFGPYVTGGTATDIVANIIIYNRWGDIIYEGRNLWDGTFKGQLQAPGQYTYTVKFNLPKPDNAAEHNTEILSGQVALIR
jgi:gliding motility-associated-like protein